MGDGPSAVKVTSTSLSATTGSPMSIAALVIALLGRLRDALSDVRARDLALLGRVLDATRNPVHGELFSYVFFAAEFTAALIEQGQRDAEHWLEQTAWAAATLASSACRPSRSTGLLRW